jgi:hypothetical protein
MEPTFNQGLIGYRYWMVDKKGLKSVAFDHTWPGRVLKSECLHHRDHIPPVKDCYCGIYGYFELKQVLTSIEHSINFWRSFLGPDQTENPTKIIVGLIIFKGQVDLYAHGARAEAAQILKLATLEGRDVGINDPEAKLNLQLSKPAIKEIEDQYQVKVTDLNQFREDVFKIENDSRFLNKQSIKDYLPKKSKLKKIPASWRNLVIAPALLFLIANLTVSFGGAINFQGFFNLAPKITPLDFKSALLVSALIVCLGIVVNSAGLIYNNLKRSPKRR